MKYFRGMASTMATLSHNERKGEQQKQLGTAEGVDGMIELKGDLEGIIDQISGGLRSGLCYLGVKSIIELKEIINQNKVEWAQCTQIGMNETGIRIKQI